MKITITLLLILSLTACSGWRLRGGDSSTLLTQSVYLSGESGETYRLVQQQLTRKQALANATVAQWHLIMGEEQWQRRTGSRTSSAQTAEYEITLTLNYRINDIDGKTVRPETEVRLFRTYTFDENDIAGKDKEEALIRKDIQRAASRQILQQLQLLQRK